MFCFNFFSVFAPVGKFIPLQLYWPMKVLTFGILSGCFLILSWFSAGITPFSKHIVFVLWIYCGFMF